jgi:GntR family transcriptional regulator
MQHSSLLLHISPSSGEPIYRQLIDQIQRLIASGKLAPGDFLPSVRQVAAELAVNPMTISKAYGLLESHGRVVRVRGKGMAIAEQANSESEEARLGQLSDCADVLIEQAKQLGLSQEATSKWLSEYIKKELK